MIASIYGGMLSEPYPFFQYPVTLISTQLFQGHSEANIGHTIAMVYLISVSCVPRRSPD